ncbi:MAG: cytidylate kinase family protein [Candidatus Magnetominusculus sp. LBB02]|nr:cytidylate kinase family protein [Candidatus Magnetominusculus sp. LBB02]
MAVITINETSAARAIAEAVSLKLNYSIIGSGEVLEAAAEEFGLPAAKIHSALSEPTMFWGMSAATRQRLTSCYQSILASMLSGDNAIYYGPTGHLLIQGVSHALKVHIHCGGKVETLCDLAIDARNTEFEEAVDVISAHALSSRYRTTTYSLNCMRNIALSSRVRAALIKVDNDVNVRAANGRVYVHVRAAETKRRQLIAAVNNIVKGISDVVNVEVTVTDDIFQKYAQTYR